MTKFLLFTSFLITLYSQVIIAQKPPMKAGDYKAHKATKTIIIDGKDEDNDWKNAQWKEINQTWLGKKPTPNDFEGKYKLLWDDNFLYFIVNIKDDSLSDQHQDPFQLWWEDDCLEIFIDENNSDGNHQYNHSAFAYHITLDLDVVDMGTKQKPILLNEHLIAKWIKTDTNNYTWEIALRVYNDSFDEKVKTNLPVKLTLGKVMGFAVSYNDNDGNFVRENFIGSVPVGGEDKNKGWIDAGIFGTVELVK